MSNNIFFIKKKKNADQYYKYVNLLLNFNGANGSTSIIDSSTVEVPIDVNGNAMLVSSTKQFGNTSLKLDGAGDFLSIDIEDHAQLKIIWINDFTMECWINPVTLTSTGNKPVLFLQGKPDSSPCGWGFGPMSDGTLRFYYYDGAEKHISSNAGVVTTNTWQHIAATHEYDTKIVNLFHNGVQVGSGVRAANPLFAASANVLFGAHNNIYYNGYIDEFRYTPKIIRYTTDFTPKGPFTTAPTYGLDANVIYLNHFDGVDGSNTFVDESRIEADHTLYGTPVIDTGQSKFGGSSLYLDGSSYITVDQNDIALGNLHSFTVECWFRREHISTFDTLIDWGRYNLGVFIRPNETDMNIYVRGSLVTPSVAWVPNTWYHIAVTRDFSDGNVRCFLNGSEIAHLTNTTILNGLTDYRIGASGHYAGENFRGWIDEVRVSRVARWTSNFTPPSQEYY